MLKGKNNWKVFFVLHGVMAQNGTTHTSTLTAHAIEKLVVDNLQEIHKIVAASKLCILSACLTTEGRRTCAQHKKYCPIAGTRCSPKLWNLYLQIILFLEGATLPLVMGEWLAWSWWVGSRHL